MSFKLRMGGTWRDPKNIHVRTGGSWRKTKRMFVRMGGTWREIWSSAIVMIKGLMRGNSTYTKITDEGTYINLQSFDLEGDAVATLVTDFPVSLTDINQVTIDWDPPVSNTGEFYLVASTNKNGDHNMYNARVLTNNRGRHETDLDVSSLSGDYYIRIHATTRPGWSNTAYLDVYGLKFDGNLVWDASKSDTKQIN